MWSVFQLLRVHQYIKNGFVLIGIIFAGSRNAWLVADSLIVFAAFCLVASGIYIMNDIFDIEADKAHPTKRFRPIAREAVSITQAWCLCGLLVLASVLLSLLVTPFATPFIVAYILLNIGYSWRWKNIAVLDVFIISAGFMLRILAGTIGIGIAPSSWLLLCGLMLTLFLGFCKRCAELLMLDNESDTERPMTREVLGSYSPIIIEQFMAISAATTILSYSLYTMSAETIERHQTQGLIFTVPFVVYGIFRYILLLHKCGKGTDTAKDFYSDRHLLVTVVAWLVTTLVLVS